MNEKMIADAKEILSGKFGYDYELEQWAWKVLAKANA